MEKTKKRMPIISIDGADGLGKSTQVELLKKHFESKGNKVEVVHFPFQKGPNWVQIDKFLKGGYGKLEKVHPKWLAVLFAHNRFDNKNVILEAIEDSKIVIIDRYVNSSIAYQCPRLSPEEADELKSFILDYEYDVLGLVKPDVSISLINDGAVELSNGDILESNKAYQQVVDKAFKDLGTSIYVATKDGARKSAETINKEILKQINI